MNSESPTPYIDLLKTTVKLPVLGEVDAEFEGDPPPAAPVAGRRVTLIRNPR